MGLLALGVLLAALLVVAAWLAVPDPGPGAPRIAVSLDRTLWHRWGMSKWTYLRAVRRAGGLPVSAAVDAWETPEAARRHLEGADGLLLGGGGDVDPRLYGAEPLVGRDVDERRDRYEMALLAEALERDLPILAICRGHQLLNVVRGGTLRDMRSDARLRRTHKRLRGHAVELVPGSRVARIFGRERLGRVVTYHGQAVAEPGDGVVLTGRAPDGVVEALELDPAVEPWVVGVQWHPEVRPWSRQEARLFEAFVAAARERGARDGGKSSR